MFTTCPAVNIVGERTLCVSFLELLRVNVPLFTPRELHSVLGEKFPAFQSFVQHDAAELLEHLLDEFGHELLVPFFF